MLYFLLTLLVSSVILSLLGLLPFGSLELMVSTVVLVVVCWVVNFVIAYILKVPTNFESSLITALILALIITPTKSTEGITFLVLAATLAMVSKYLFAFDKKHLFNPATLSVFLTLILVHKGASWWVGNSSLLPVALVGGLLIVRKIKRFDLVLSFLAVPIIFALMSAVLSSNNPFISIKEILIDSPLIFFATVMLTEPQTTPPTRNLRFLYGGLVGILSIFFSTESSLLTGNIVSFLVSPKGKFRLKLKEKKELALSIYQFSFSGVKGLQFKPGQYLEWTLGRLLPDSRGSRRYFTVASSPTEGGIKIVIKVSENSSSFKKDLMALPIGGQIMVGQLSGDFILPKDVSKKLVFIAGGIGVTPFRSMVKYLVDTNEKRDVVLFYSAKDVSEFVFKDVFLEAGKKLGIKIIYNTEILDAKAIEKEVPDYKQRTFYLSGPHGMVIAFEKTLSEMGISKTRIKTDYFPGY